jgi:hypothetical protein
MGGNLSMPSIPYGAKFPNRARRTWRDDATEQGLVADPSEIRTIAFHPQLVPLTGSLAAAVLLGQLLYWRGKQRDPDGWRYKQQQEVQQETSLTRRSQESARRNLRRCGILEERYDRFPRRLNYRVNFDAFRDAWRRQYHHPPPAALATPSLAPLQPVQTAPASMDLNEHGKNTSKNAIMYTPARDSHPTTGHGLEAPFSHEINRIDTMNSMKEDVPHTAGAPMVSPPNDLGIVDNLSKIDIVHETDRHTDACVQYEITEKLNETIS